MIVELQQTVKTMQSQLEELKWNIYISN
jgi:hypothetical protein